MSTAPTAVPTPLEAATERHPHARAVLGGAVRPLPDGTLAPSHAYLLHGPPGAGKREAARAFAAALLADGAADPVDAARRAQDGVHPDLTWVVPSGAAVMRVVDVEEPVVAAATRTPFESARRVFVLQGAETLNDEAANRLLKTLEEPPPFAHLLLLADRIGDVLPTIASRCQRVRFEAPSPAELAERLQGRGVPPAAATACARLSLGDGDRALELALGDGPARRAAAEAFARATLHGTTAERPWVQLIDAAATAAATAGEGVEAKLAAELPFLPRREQARAKREATEAAKRATRRARAEVLDGALGLAGLWLRDVACVVDGAEELCHAQDRLDALREDAEPFGRSGALRDGVARIDETRAALKLVNATEELALEALAYALERELARA